MELIENYKYLSTDDKIAYHKYEIDRYFYYSKTKNKSDDMIVMEHSVMIGKILIVKKRSKKLKKICKI